MTEPRDPYADLARAVDDVKAALMAQLDRYLGPVVRWLSRRLDA